MNGLFLPMLGLPLASTPASGSSPPPTSFRLLEDGTSFRLLEDGTSKRLLE